MMQGLLQHLWIHGIHRKAKWQSRCMASNDGYRMVQG